MKRLVETDRWKDAFFVELHPNAKLLLSYMYDNCNEAGFIDLNWVIWSSQLNMQQEFIKTSLIALSSLLVSDKKKKLFIKDFLKHQRKLPLIRGNQESDLIIEKLQSNLKKFNDAPEILELLNSVKLPEIETKSVIPNKAAPKRFSAPSYEEFEGYYLSQSPDTGTENIKELFDHYVSVGWKTSGGTPVKDFEAAIRNAIRRAEKNSILKQSRDFKNKTFGKESYIKKDEKQSRSQITFSVAEELKQETKAK